MKQSMRTFAIGCLAIICLTLMARWSPGETKEIAWAIFAIVGAVAGRHAAPEVVARLGRKEQTL